MFSKTSGPEITLVQQALQGIINYLNERKSKNPNDMYERFGNQPWGNHTSYDVGEKRAWGFFEFLKDYDSKGCLYRDPDEDITNKITSAEGHQMQYKVLMVYLLLSENNGNRLKKHVTDSLAKKSLDIDKLKTILRFNYSYTENFLDKLPRHLPAMRDSNNNVGIFTYPEFEKNCRQLVKALKNNKEEKSDCRPS